MTLSTVLLILGAFYAWVLLGCVVLGLIDDREGRLFRWASSAPFPGLYTGVLILWPLVAWRWFRSA